MTSGTSILAAAPDSGTDHPVLPVPVQPNLSVEGLVDDHHWNDGW